MNKMSLCLSSRNWQSQLKSRRSLWLQVEELRGIIMHEMSLCEGIVQVLENERSRQSFERVNKVFLEIGALAGVEIEALKFCYEVVCQDTVAKGSTLEIIEIPGKAWCMQCAKELQVEARYSACDYCGGYQLQVTGGDEMKIKELEVA